MPRSPGSTPPAPGRRSLAPPQPCRPRSPGGGPGRRHHAGRLQHRPTSACARAARSPGCRGQAAGRHRLPGAGRQALRRRRAGGVYTIDDGRRGHQGQATEVELDGQNFGVDFNPAANALRIISDTGQNLRQPFADAAPRPPTDKALTNPATPPATGTVPARAPQRRLHQQRRGHRAPAPRCSCSTPRPTGCPSSPRPTPARSPRWARSGSTRRRAGFDIYSPAGAPAADVTALATLQVGGKYGLYRVDLLTGKATSWAS